MTRKKSPQDFGGCVKAGGKVRTIKPNAGTYLRLCRKGGKWFRDEVKHTKNNSSKALTKASRVRVKHAILRTLTIKQLIDKFGHLFPDGTTLKGMKKEHLVQTIGRKFYNT